MDLLSYLLGKKSAGSGGGVVLTDYLGDTIANRSSSNKNQFATYILKKSFDIINIDDSTTDLSGLFQNTKLLSIPKVIGGKNSTSFAQMYGNTSPNTNITSLDVSGLNTSNGTSMSGMFQGLSNLTSITGLLTFNTDKVTTFQSMFNGCGSLTELDLSSFTNSDGVLTNTKNMFDGCKDLTKIDLRGLTFSTVSSYSNMFGADSSASKVPRNCLIIVKDSTEKAWINTNLSSMTNVKTVEELSS